MDALKKEIEELEAAENKEADDEVVEEVADEQQEEDQEVIEEKEIAEDAEKEDVSAEDAETAKKQEAYRERQRQKKEKAAQQTYDDAANKAVSTTERTQEDRDDAAELKEAAELIRQDRAERQFEQSIKAAEKELNSLEPEFKAAFTDYDDVVNDALELTRMRLVADGATEGEAKDYLRREKVLLADRAAAQGKDPVEAVYNEAKSIINVFDAYAEKKGYTKGKAKPKTNLQAMREISKPNAMTGGSNSKAVKGTFGDMDLQETDDLSIGQMLQMQAKGELRSV